MLTEGVGGLEKPSTSLQTLVQEHVTVARPPRGSAVPDDSRAVGAAKSGLLDQLVVFVLDAAAVGRGIVV
jgi:hypothetical protein